ncbi:MAG: DNA repair protein RadC [Bacteroidaceae bacterium]|nr:DNA repair protein RadC [Bacteroidaceae bacterium]
MPDRLNINEWAVEDRPREKLAAKGAAALSDAELLAILIGSGTPHEDAVTLMRRILQDCGQSLKQLGRKSLQELTAYKGVGPAKAITIMAACELGRRRQGEEVQTTAPITNSQQAYEQLLPLMQDLNVEESRVLLLNRAHKVIESRLVSRGGLTGTVVDVRDVLRSALLAGATSLVLAHNHPSGNTCPSREDDALTQKLQQAALTMDIRLLDHIIVTDGAYYSYADEGKL